MPDSPPASTQPLNGPAWTSRPRHRQRPAPGCALCTILVKLEEDAQQPVDQDEQTVTYTSLVEQPPSPAIASPSVTQNPLLSSLATTRSSASRAAVDGRVLVVDDDALTGWIASPSERLANEGRHAVIAFKRHVDDVYAFGPADIPLLVHALQTAHAILDRAPSSSRSGGKGKGKATSEQQDERDGQRFEGCGEGSRRIGFLTGLTRDPQFPYGHLHIHATLGPYDAASWYRRTIAHNAWSPGWWDLEDLIAEIRETTSNNRVKSGHVSRRNAPLANAPTVGSRTGLPNALEPKDRSERPIAFTATDTPASAADIDVDTGTYPSRIRMPTAKHDDVSTALLDAVIRDAERKLWIKSADTGGRPPANDQRKAMMSREPSDGRVTVEGKARAPPLGTDSNRLSESTQARISSETDHVTVGVPP